MQANHYRNITLMIPNTQIVNISSIFKVTFIKVLNYLIM